MFKKKKRKSEEPEFGWQNISLWNSKTGNSAMSGRITFTPEFLDNLLEMVESEEVELDDRGYIVLSVTLRENDNATRNAPVLLGSIWVAEPQEEEEQPARKKKTTSTARRRRMAEEDDADEEEEVLVDPRRRQARTRR